MELQDVSKDNIHVACTRQRVLKDGGERLVLLHGNHLFCDASQALRDHAGPRTHFKRAVFSGQFRCVDNPLKNSFIDEKVLPKLFLKGKSVFREQRLELARLRYIPFNHSRYPFVP